MEHRSKRLAAKLSCDNVEFLAGRPRDEAQQLIAAADVGFVGAQPGLYDVAYPSKMMSYLRAGLPVLVHVEPTSAMAAFLNENGLGVAASPTSVSAAAESIDTLVTQVAAGQFDPAGIAARANEIYSRETYFQRYEQLIQRCTAAA